MRFTRELRWIDDSRRYSWLWVCLCVVVVACTNRQAYEGLKAGHRSGCLEYPESEYQDCVEESETSYHDYQRERDEIVGD
ncbi:MAG: hypothetical protein HKP12_16095 [Gammaproteobacteria bacterium]|nr:hypothetical protein [Gammaproteobacteria bacterium]NNJ98668.1 hypothetical protein [Gammaproteobacteria bacterium]